MIRVVFTEVREGYSYPNEWNRSCREFNCRTSMEPEPTRAERVSRAARWGWAELRTILAERVHPDG